MRSGHLTIQSESSFPTWTFSHYLSVLEANYLKLFQVYKVIELLNEGASDEQFFVTAYSAELYPSEPIRFRDDSRLVVLAEKGKSAKEFWQEIRKRHRPLVFYRGGEGSEIPLYVIGSRFALRIPRARVASPIEINAKGGAEILHELRYGSAEEARAQERHELEMTERRVKLARDRIQATQELITLMEALESAKISQHMKREITELVQETRESQAEHNRKLTAKIELDLDPGDKEVQSEK
jgi:hypothetical protein